jgi:hypothetical protein
MEATELEFEGHLDGCGAYDCDREGVTRVVVPQRGDYEYDRYGFEVRLGEEVRVLVCEEHRDNLKQAYADYRKAKEERAAARAAADAEVERLEAQVAEAKRKRDRI